MKGNCETCAKRDSCKKDIGFMFGFCNTDYEPDTVEIARQIMELLPEEDRDWFEVLDAVRCGGLTLEEVKEEMIDRAI